MKKYVIGVDFGTLSTRAVLCDTKGEIFASCESEYAHGVMTEGFPDGWAIQDPRDYLPSLKAAVGGVLGASKIDPADVAGICADFTASSPMTLGPDGKPLCTLPKYENEPLAKVLLWKHHGAQAYADRLNGIAADMGEEWLDLYGGSISCEWFFPKVMQIAAEAPDVYRDAAYIVEAGDYISYALSGVHTVNACAAGYKMLYASGAFPKEEFFKRLSPELENVVADKINAPVVSPGTFVGHLTKEMSEYLGLPGTCAVGAGIIDGHAAMPASGITGEGQLLLIMGTSACHFLLSSEYRHAPGVCGCVKDGIYEGFYAYEAGQSCFGEHYSWVADTCSPPSYREEALKRGISLHTLLSEKASLLSPGQSGLVALDWFGGNRCTLNDSSLSGLILGLTTATKPEEIYSAFIEATAFGTKAIIDNYTACGLLVNEIRADGGIAAKNSYAVSVMADVTGLPVSVGGGQGGALGSAIYAACAAGIYPSVSEGALHMSPPPVKIYLPDKDRTVKYNILYEYYRELYEHFGKATDIMKALRNIRKKEKYE